MSTGETPGRGKPRGGNGQFTRSVDTAERDALAARLRATGASYRQIAERLNFANEGGAHRAVSRALAAVPVEDVAELRAIECARLDEITARLWSVMNTKYPVGMTAGRRIVDQHDRPIEDPAPLLAVVDRLLRITAQRARLLGLDAAPPKREAEEPSPAVLELLRGLVALLAIEPADTRDARTLLALPAVLQGETEAVHRDR